MSVVVSRFHFVPALIFGMVNAVATLYIDIKKMKLEETMRMFLFTAEAQSFAEATKRGKREVGEHFFQLSSSLLFSLRFLCLLRASAVN